MRHPNLKRTGRLSFYAALAVAAFFLMLYPATAAEGALRGVRVCLDVLIPSLFPFMFLCVFSVKSGASRAAGRRLERPARAFLGLPGGAAAAVLMALVGGYPVGARSTAALYENGEITEQEAARMLCFCVCAGPGFVLGVVGAGFLRSPTAGAVLLAAELLSALILGVLCGLGKPRKGMAKPKNTPPVKAAPAMIASAADAAASMTMMCCFVVLFAALLELAGMWLHSPAAYGLVYALTEVTGGCARLAEQGAPLWAVGIALGWGGLCVHFQVLACASGVKINYGKFFLFRLLHGVLAGTLTFLLSRLIPAAEVSCAAVPVFSVGPDPTLAGLSGGAAASLALAGVCALFLISVSRAGNRRDGMV